MDHGATSIVHSSPTSVLIDIQPTQDQRNSFSEITPLLAQTEEWRPLSLSRATSVTRDLWGSSSKEERVEQTVGAAPRAESGSRAAETLAEPDSTTEPSVCTLFHLVNKIWQYEPSLYSQIEVDVATRGLTQSEKVAKAAFSRLEERGQFCRDRVRRKILDDKKISPGFGPVPSNLEVGCRPLCGTNRAHWIARKWLDPVVRQCLCIKFTPYGRLRRESPLFIVQVVAITPILINLVNMGLKGYLAYDLNMSGHREYAAMLACGLVGAILAQGYVMTRVIEWSDISRQSWESKIAAISFMCTASFVFSDATAMYLWYHTEVFNPDSAIALASVYLSISTGLLESAVCLFFMTRFYLENSLIPEYPRLEVLWLIAMVLIVLSTLWWTFVSISIIVPNKQGVQEPWMNVTVLGLYVLDVVLIVWMFTVIIVTSC
eukprot:m.213752 g.213752  ORF g.213752 m.213752 type:complete len:432 (+) comp15526_c0_seq4:776-2071(+)